MSFDINRVYHQVFMGEGVIHTPEDPDEILATDGLISCIAFAGWEPRQRIGFLIHFASPEQVEDFYSRGIEILSKKCGAKGTSIFQCAIRGGCKRTSISSPTLAAIKSGLLAHERIHFEVVEEALLSDRPVTRSLSLDCSSGTFHEYDSREDPTPRVKTPIEEMRDLSPSLYEELYYRFSPISYLGIPILKS